MSLIKKITIALRNYFVSGLLAILPLALTIWLIHFSITMVKRWLEPILHILPTTIQQIPHAEIMLTLIVILCLGMLLRSLLLNRLIQELETLITSIPLVKSIYLSIKQLVATLDSKNQSQLKKTVLLQYPRTGIYTIGFVTGAVPPKLAPAQETDYYSVFVPTTPNPTSGFYLILKKTDFVELAISRQEALSLIISGGLIIPERLIGQAEQERSKNEA